MSLALLIGLCFLAQSGLFGLVEVPPHLLGVLFLLLALNLSRFQSRTALAGFERLVIIRLMQLFRLAERPEIMA